MLAPTPFLPPRYNNLKVRFPTQSEATVLLLNLLLTYDPSRRIDAATALAHPYFSELPMRKSARPRPHPAVRRPCPHHALRRPCPHPALIPRTP